MSGMAPAKSINFTVTIPRSCILIVDDDQKFLKAARGFFSARNYDVVTALTPEEATPLLEAHAKEPKYRIILTDDNFGRLSKTKGHQFILKNRHLLGKAKTVIVSGAEQPSQEIFEQLEEANTPYIEKNESLNEALKELTQKDSEAHEKDIENIVKDKLADLPTTTGAPVEVKMISKTPTPSEQPFSEETLSRLKRTITNWLGSRGDLDMRVLAYGNHVYSPNEMIKHIEDETAIGRAHLLMLLDEFEYSQENNDDDPPRYDEGEYTE